MKPADTLRRAAALMRERAEAATPGLWMHEQEMHQDHGGADTFHHVATSETHVAEVERAGDAEHAKSWQPRLALAVANLLEAHADSADAMPAAIRHRKPGCPYDRALAVAVAYLGETP